jgi:hypothetical protein
VQIHNPTGVKLKMRRCQLRSGVNWLGDLNKKRGQYRRV